MYNKLVKDHDALIGMHEKQNSKLQDCYVKINSHSMVNDSLA
jgi:hypothetical protein